MKRYFKIKHMHKIKWEFRYTKSAIDYTIGGEKLAKIIKDVRVCKGVEISRDHCFKHKIIIPSKMGK